MARVSLELKNSMSFYGVTGHPSIEQFAACTMECIPVTVHISNRAVHMLPEGCDYKEKIPNLSVSGE